MKIVHETWGHIPLLHMFDEGKATSDTPVVLFLHGFESAKEHNLHYAYNLVNKGMRVIMPDALLHGERSEGLDAIQLSMRFWEIVLTNIQEVKFLYEQLVSKGLLSGGKIGLAGSSMGAITTSGCLSVYPWITTATLMMGTPRLVELAKAQLEGIEAKGLKLPITEKEVEQLLATIGQFDISQNVAALQQRPLFFWHGKKDTMVSYEADYSFYEEIAPLYEATPHKLKFMTNKSAGHKVDREGMLASVNWMADYLA